MEPGVEYVTMTVFQWVIGGLSAAVALGGSALGGFVFGFRSTLGKRQGEDKEKLQGEISAAKATLFTKLDKVRDDCEADAKAAERDLAAYKLVAAKEFVTLTHLHGVEVRIDTALREIGSDVKHLLRSGGAPSAAEREDWEPGD